MGRDTDAAAVTVYEWSCVADGRVSLAHLPLELSSEVREVLVYTFSHTLEYVVGDGHVPVRGHHGLFGPTLLGEFSQEVASYSAEAQSMVGAGNSSDSACRGGQLEELSHRSPVPGRAGGRETGIDVAVRELAAGNPVRAVQKDFAPQYHELVARRAVRVQCFNVHTVR